MTIAEFEEKSFEGVMSQLNEELDEITTLDNLKEFAKSKIDDGNYFLANHIIQALQNGNNEDCGIMIIVWVLLIRQFH